MPKTLSNADICLPEIPRLPQISGDELFKDDEKAHTWFNALRRREGALTRLVETTIASLFTKDGRKDAEEFEIVSPCTDGQYQYQMTKFDKLGPVYDVRRNDAKEIAKEIPGSYYLVEMIKK